MNQNPNREITQVAIPSRIKTTVVNCTVTKERDCYAREGNILHRHALYPLIPFIRPIALAKRPPKAPANVVELKKKENLFCASVRLYHIDNK